jgi:hypothetical protein
MADQFVGAPDPRAQYSSVAQWLHQLLVETPHPAPVEQLPIGEDVSLASTEYHPAFYPQIPNFALALLKHDSEAPIHYAPLLFHLLSCPTCHRAYLEIYDALRAAVLDEVKPATTALRISSTTTLATTSPKQLVFLCQLLIAQAKAVLRQAHRERSDQDVWARSLLQQAMQISRYIMQGTLRQRALRDLVEVASLTVPPSTSAVSDIPAEQTPLSYAPLVGSGSGTRGRTMRRAEIGTHSNEPGSIDLRANALEGSITQQDDLLILHLAELEERLRGKSLLVSIPLGTLLEPIRWLGGNPYAIRSTNPVSIDGKLSIPLGRTELHLSNPEERNLVETLLKRLDVYPVN